MSSYTDQHGGAGLAPGQEKTGRGPQRRRRQGGGQLTAKVRDATLLPSELNVHGYTVHGAQKHIEK